ncbi:FHA domain-containing protein [Streptomyces sp. NPDC054796]
MTSLEFSAYPPRLSDVERERALEVLREGAVQGRISQNTFEQRMDVILHAQWHGELHAALFDLPTRRPRSRWFVQAVGRLSAFPGTLRKAWQTERLPELLLPQPGPYPFTIGRAPGSMLRLNHFTVSRVHAQLRSKPEGWSLRDLGSSNGTWVNGSRIAGSVSVRPGDQVRFGQVGFRLTVPKPPELEPPEHT